ncbi:MAG TPA: hypothetical protein VLF41_03780 [Candidatus Nanoarchaeia archaeon]|nr:hypothetical protein [Candidatus Nanoarchaeia archaeon]
MTTAELSNNDTTYDDRPGLGELRKVPGMLIELLRDCLVGLVPGLTKAA